MREIEAERHRRDRERGKVVGVIVVEPSEPPRISGADVEAPDDDGGINRRRKQVRSKQAFHVVPPSNPRGHHEVHQYGLGEVAEDQVEAVAHDERTGHGERHPDEQGNQPLRGIDPNEA